MSNSFQSVSSGLGFLKNFYQGPLVDQFNEDVKLYSLAEKSKFAWSGTNVYRPLKVRRNQGVGATSDGGNLPAIGKQTAVQAVVPAKYNYLRFGITGPMIKASQNEKGSFVRQVDYEIKEGYNDLKSDCNRQIGWDGTSDLALVNTTAAASTSIVIKGRETGEAALKFVDVGAVLDFYSGSTLVAAGVEVLAISSGTAISTTATITLSVAVSVTAGDVLCRAGSFGQEVQGILTQLDGGTTTLFTNLNRSLYPSLQGNAFDLGGAQMKLIDLQTAYQAGKLRGGKAYKGIYSDFDSQSYYTKLLQADKRYVNANKGDGGFGNKDEMTLEYNGCPWNADKDAPKRVFFLAEGAIEKMVLAEMDFADEGGSYMIEQVGADAYEVRIRHFFNMFNSQANACAILSNYISP